MPLMALTAAGVASQAISPPQQYSAGPAVSSNGNVFVASPGLGNLSELLNQVMSAPSTNGGGYYSGSAVPLSAYEYPKPSIQPLEPVVVTPISNGKIMLALGLGLLAAFVFIR